VQKFKSKLSFPQGFERRRKKKKVMEMGKFFIMVAAEPTIVV